MTTTTLHTSDLREAMLRRLGDMNFEPFGTGLSTSLYLKEREYIADALIEAITIEKSTPKTKFRPIHIGMVTDFILMCQAQTGDEFIHVPTVTNSKGGDVVKLRHYGLIEKDERPRADGGSRGQYRVVALGRRWFNNEVGIPKMLNQKTNEISGPEVFITDFFDGFDLRHFQSA